MNKNLIYGIGSIVLLLVVILIFTFNKNSGNASPGNASAANTSLESTGTPSPYEGCVYKNSGCNKTLLSYQYQVPNPYTAGELNKDMPTINFSANLCCNTNQNAKNAQNDIKLTEVNTRLYLVSKLLPPNIRGKIISNSIYAGHVGDGGVHIKPITSKNIGYGTDQKK